MEKNRKVAVISIWDIDNYGNRLQNYAMQWELKKLGYDPYTLKMWPQKRLKRILQYLTNFDVSYLRMLKLKMSKNMRKYNFLSFERKHIQKDRRFYHSIEDRDLINRQYSRFIVGSDQVWHPVFLEEPYYFLKFADKDATTMAYAASMGVSSLNEEDSRKMKDGMAYIQSISVREDSAAKVIKDITGKEVSVVIDPTLFVPNTEWERLERKPEKLKRDYLLLYYLGEISETRWTFLNKISKENNLELVILGKPEYQDFYDAGPAEFLYLIHHAKLMCTDSFHGCVFSFLFETPFYVFEREDHLEKMNSRIDTLLQKFHLNNRYANEKEQKYSLECDFSKGKEILEGERVRSEEFIVKGLEGQERSV